MMHKLMTENNACNTDWTRVPMMFLTRVQTDIDEVIRRVINPILGNLTESVQTG
eukprot:COSAG02_NODE_166_length_31947_cov_34.168617_10_plen_54_part_00